MADMQFGIFLIFLALGVIFIIVSSKFGSMYKLAAAIMFFTLGIIMLGLTDIVMTTTTTIETAGTNASGTLTFFTENKTETIRIIGDGNANTDDNHNILGWLFMALAIFQVIDFFDKSMRNKDKD